MTKIKMNFIFDHVIHHGLTLQIVINIFDIQWYDENILKIDWNMIELGMELSWTKWAGQAAAAVPVEAQGLEFINQILGLLLLLLVESE